MIADILAALVPGLARLIESALSDNYDAEAEKQALLQMQRAAADLRARKLLDSVVADPVSR